MKIEYRQATNSDINYCEKTHHEGMKPYCEPLWGWDENFQHERFKRLWTPQRIKLIILNSSEVGYLETESKGKVIKIVNVFVNSNLRNQGIGSQVVNEFINSCKGCFNSITLNVLHNNPAKNLYERVGFKFVSKKDQLLVYELKLNSH